MKTGTIETQPFEVTIPDLSGEKVERVITIQVPMEWDDEVKEWLMTKEGLRLVEDTEARAMGLILPEQMKSLRDRLGYTQKQMGELFQVGGKSWTRWETGRHRPSRVISLLIRALSDGEISIDYLLERAGKKTHESPWMEGVLAERLCAPQKSFFQQPVHVTLSRSTKAEFSQFASNTVNRCRATWWSGVVLSASHEATPLDATLEFA